VAGGADESGEKQFEASQHKLDQAKERGEVPQSRDTATFGLYVAFALGVGMLGPRAASDLAALGATFLGRADDLARADTPSALRGALAGLLGDITLSVGPFFLLLVAGVLIAYLGQGTVVFAAKRLEPRLDKFNPFTSLKNMFGPKGLVELAKGIAKVILSGIAAWFALEPTVRRSVDLVRVDPVALPGLLGEAILRLTLFLVGVSLLVAAVDVFWQRMSFRKKMMMSLQELREEMKATDGSPEVKQQQRAARNRLAQERIQMMAAVPTATVVITNPTHYSVALAYDPAKPRAPVVVAKGVDEIALVIRTEARKHGVPIQEAPPLARALYATVKVGQEIAPEHYTAAATVIRTVLALSRGRGARR
jgi:flagellar biosynthetic protein FlhB